jgi:hypothetical protein
VRKITNCSFILGFNRHRNKILPTCTYCAFILFIQYVIIFYNTGEKKIRWFCPSNKMIQKMENVIIIQNGLSNDLIIFIDVINAIFVVYMPRKIKFHLWFCCLLFGRVFSQFLTLFLFVFSKIMVFSFYKHHHSGFVNKRNYIHSVFFLLDFPKFISKIIRIDVHALEIPQRVILMIAVISCGQTPWETPKRLFQYNLI